MVQTISSSLLIFGKEIIILIYVPLTQPLTPKDPIRDLEFNTVYCKLGLLFPLINTDGYPLIEENIFFKLPLYTTLY
jgi:hypothetical protein